MKRILFQGDSITDAGRSRHEESLVNYAGGYGYPTLVAAQLGYEKPNEYEFFNRGISGNRSIDLLARVKCDIINLKPDYLSILIGVNDVWHELGGNCNGVDADRFELFYDILISQIKEALPNIRIMILEPFLQKGVGTETEWDVFRGEVEKRAAAAKRIAEKHNLVFVPLMDRFDEALKYAPTEHWTLEGVHPTAMGHEIIKRAWLEGFSKL